jgi:transposase
MIALAQSIRIFVYTQPTDMRKSFHGLSGLVTQHFDVGLCSGNFFLFFNRRRDCVKILAWDEDGLAIWYKRLEEGTFQLSPLNSQGDTVELDRVKLSMLLSGIDLNSVKRRKRFNGS